MKGRRGRREEPWPEEDVRSSEKRDYGSYDFGLTPRVKGSGTTEKEAEIREWVGKYMRIHTSERMSRRGSGGEGE